MRCSLLLELRSHWQGINKEMDPTPDLGKISHIHFIGICGSGMSSIANLMHSKGKIVTGSDRSLNGHDEENISSDIDLVVYTVAVSLDNPELVKAKELNIPILTYPKMLGLLSKNMYTVAVSGTHGKTTTTAMIASILHGTTFDPTVIIGSHIMGLDTNSLLGAGTYLLTEADEYRKSFLNLYPSALVITNVDEDHLDFYKDLNDIQNSFRELVKRVPKEGFVICDTTDLHLSPIIKDLSCRVIDYKSVRDIELMIPGKHNRNNAKAALMLTSALGIEESFARGRLREYKGVSRRFEYKGKTVKGALVFDDYAHNPQKVASALSGAREAFSQKKIVAIFQPHLYSRTKKLLPAFSCSFDDADQVFLVPIYAARESFDPTISSDMLCEEINKRGVKAESFNSHNSVKEKLKEEMDENCIIVLLGAGDITLLANDLVE